MQWIEWLLFLQQSKGYFSWHGLKSIFQKSIPFYLLLKKKTKTKNTRPLRKSLLTEKPDVCSQPFPPIYFLGNTVSHSESCCNYSSPPISLFLQYKLARNVRSRTNGLVTAVAAALSHRLWPELWAAEGKATGSQLLILSPLSILNGAQVPSKHAFLAGSWEPQQNSVLPTLPDRSVNYWNSQLSANCLSATTGSHQSYQKVQLFAVFWSR